MVSVSSCDYYNDPAGVVCGMGNNPNNGSPTDTCQGDSGGPFFKKGATAADDVIYGVTSYGDGCAEPGVPGAYADLHAFMLWMRAEMFKEGIPLNETKYEFFSEYNRWHS